MTPKRSHFKRFWSRGFASGLSLALLGCASTHLPPPPPAVPAQFKEDALWQHAAAASTASVPEAWWQVFKDPVLDDLQGQLVIGNESLKSALSQIENARATLKASQAALWPTLSVGAGADRGGTPAGVNSPRVTANSYSLTANAAWEADLWGRLSQAVRAAESTLQASRDDLAAARLSVQAVLVQSYFAMRAAEAQHALLEQTVIADQRSLELTQARYAAGVVALSDILQAQTQILTVQAQVREAVVQRAQLEHAIAVLLGRAPAALTIARTATLPDMPEIPKLLPATLLERRPDIAAAERRVAAAYAQIGVTDAAFFPSVTLSASAGYRGSSLGQLVSAPNLLWSLGTAVTQAVFDSGARQLASDQARAAADQATSAYRQIVLTSLQEVEDNLVTVDQLSDELRLQQDALRAARRTLEIIQDQYKAGTVSYLNVVTEQTVVLTAEASVLSLRNRLLAATNTLLKNIGGRWSSN